MIEIIMKLLKVYGQIGIGTKNKLWTRVYMPILLNKHQNWNTSHILAIPSFLMEWS